MDGRVLLNSSPKRSLGKIPELAGWAPGAPDIHSAGPVEHLEPVSLIIPTFFNAELKRRSLQFVLAGIHQCRSIRELILVSSDGEPREFSELKSVVRDLPVRVVASDPHNRGKSRNAGAAAATCPHLLFLDDDMLPRNWQNVDAILSRLLASGQDVALFPRRQYARFPLLFDSAMLRNVIELWRSEGGAARSPFLYDPLQEGARDLPMLFCFPGCFMLIRKCAYERLSGFTENFTGWGFEDTDFAVRAMRELKVLNLFRTGEPLLHIDHPVSPYKSEEHNANFEKFYASLDSPDMNSFCRTVFRGADFPSETDMRISGPAAWVSPLKQIVRRGIPANVRRAHAWWTRLAHRRLRRHLGPLPVFIALHGSRADGTAEFEGDYDVLSLYDGPVQEFFVCAGDARVEIECADLHRFEHIARHPSIHSMTGAMELAKLAGARLLWGHPPGWREWSSHVLSTAMAQGWCYWLVLGLGLRRHAAKYGPMADRYFAALRKLRAQAIAAGRFHVNGEGDFSDEAALTLAAEHALNQFSPDWRRRVRNGESVFEFQVPEVWTALHALGQARQKPKDQPKRRALRPRFNRLEPLNV